MDSTRVTQILSSARLRTNPDDYPTLARLRRDHGLAERGVGSGRHVPYLNQQEMDLLLGYEPGRDVYRRLENARTPNPSEALLRAVGTLLKLREHEWHELHIALHGHKAPKALDPQAGHGIARSWHRVIHQHPDVAYASDCAWNVLDHNAAADALFGPMPDNIMRWMLSLPPNADSRQRMPDWEVSWLPVALSQLRSAVCQEPTNAILRQIEAEVLADDKLAAIYTSNLDPYLHPDGTRRLMVHPGRDMTVGVMNAAAGEPMCSPGARVVFMSWSPLDDDALDAPRTSDGGTTAEGPETPENGAP